MTFEGLTPSTRTERAQVTLVIAAAGCVGLAMSLLLPLFISPDEPAHADGVSHIVAEGGFLTGGEANMSEQIVRAQGELQTTAPLRPGVPLRRFLVEDATPRADRPKMDELGTTADTNSVNYIANHPPTHYLITGIITRTAMATLPEGVWSFDRELLVMRWVNVLMLMGTTALTYPLARSVGLGHRGGLVAMTLPLGIPQYVHIGASINNDNFYVLTSTAFALAMILLVRPSPGGQLDGRAALATGVTAGAVVLSKAQGLAALVMAAGLTVWLLSTSRPGRRAAALRLAVGSVVVAGPLLLMNVVRTGTISPREASTGPPVDAPVDVLAWGREWLNLGSRTFWGAFGWLDAALPWQLVHTLSVLTALAGLAALVMIWRRDTRWVLVPWIYGVLAAGIPVSASLMTHLDSGAMRAMQGRYLYPIVPLAACTLVLAYRPILRRRPAIAIGLAVAASFAIAVLAIVTVDTVLGRHWGPDGASVAASMEALAAWSPVPFAGTSLIGLLAVVGVASIVAIPTVTTVSAARARVEPLSDDRRSPDAAQLERSRATTSASGSR